MRKVLKIFSFYIYPAFIAAMYIVLSYNEGHFISMFVLIMLAWHISFTIILNTVNMRNSYYLVILVIKITPVAGAMVFCFILCALLAGLGHYPAAFYIWLATALSALPAYAYDISVCAARVKA